MAHFLRPVCDQRSASGGDSGEMTSFSIEKNILIKTFNLIISSYWNNKLYLVRSNGDVLIILVIC